MTVEAKAWVICAAALVIGALLIFVGARPRRYRPMAGAWGAFPVRMPFGKLAAVVVALGTLPGAWMLAERFATPVQWAEKGVYLATWKDGLLHNLKPAAFRHGSGVRSYRVLVTDATNGKKVETIYLDDSLLRLGMKPRVMETAADPMTLHRTLDSVVYGGEFWRMFIWPVGGWLLLGMVMLASGSMIDMRRLREARNLGVHLSGNREVPLEEWNKAARSAR